MYKSHQHLFLYGSLQSKIKNPFRESIDEYIELLEPGYFFGKLFDLGEYPGAIESKEPNNKVFGEIYKIHNSCKLFKVLDEYEDYYAKDINNSEYIRKIVSVYSTDFKKYECWAYIYNQSVKEYNLIANGNYLKFLACKQNDRNNQL